jgi:DNA-binding response OmpR family regulator
MKGRVLVAEDEPALASGLVVNLSAEGLDVLHVARGDQALKAIADEPFALIVLDLCLPGVPGLEVLKDLRGRGCSTPVLILSARGDVVDRVVGLELGADDYLGKPFALAELIARTRALLRRGSAGAHGPGRITVAGVTFDFLALTASDPGLTLRDVLVMKVLAARRGEVVSRPDIVEEACGLDSDVTLRSVDNHVVALRRSLRDDPRRPRFIRSVRGQGYRLEREGST